MNITLPATVAVSLILGLLPAANAQQRLYALDSTGQIAEVLQFSTTTASLSPIATLPLGTGELPRGLAFEPVTGDFFALTLSGANARIVRLDRVSGQLTTVCNINAPLADGLDRRFDGTLVFAESLDTLVLVDPATCAVARVPTDFPIGLHTSEGSVAWGPRGLVVALGGDGTNQRIDPLDGSSSPFGAALFSGTRALEVDTDGTIYYGQYDGSLFWSGVQLGQALPGTGVGMAGLAFSIASDGMGMSIACSGNPNSSGVSATIEALGSAAVVDGDLELRCRNLPPNTFGMFIVGPNAGSMPLGSGVLCIGQPQQRYNQSVQNAGVLGRVQFEIDLMALPNGAPVVPGSTYYFQYWHRDSPGTSNLSPALRMDFR